MAASGLYGVVVAAAFWVCVQLAPQPAGSVIYWGLLSLQLTWGALVCWRRTGLPFMTAGLAAGAVTSACLTVIAVMGGLFPNFSAESWVLLGGGLALPPLFFHIESRANRDTWRQVAQHMERAISRFFGSSSISVKRSARRIIVRIPMPTIKSSKLSLE